MQPINARIGALLDENLDVLLEAVLAAYDRSIPRVAACSPEERSLVVSGTRAGIRAFATLLADPAAHAAGLLARARTATVERSGEVFTRDEILDMVRIARQVVAHMMREIAGAELDLTDSQRAEVEAVLDAFNDELARAEGEVLPPTAVDLLLRRAEQDEVDLG